MQMMSTAKGKKRKEWEKNEYISNTCSTQEMPPSLGTVSVKKDYGEVLSWLENKIWQLILEIIDV